MRKILSLLAALALPLFAQINMEIRTVADLTAIAGNGGVGRLMNDIVVDSNYSTRLVNQTLDGQGHTITFSGSKVGALFNSIYKSEIKNLNIVNGILASISDGVTIDNCHIKFDSIVVTNVGSNNVVYAGGMIKEARDRTSMGTTIKNSSVTGKIKVYSDYREGTFSNDVIKKGNISAAGGFIGYASDDGINIMGCSFYGELYAYAAAFKSTPINLTSPNDVDVPLSSGASGFIGRASGFYYDYLLNFISNSYVNGYLHNDAEVYVQCNSSCSVPPGSHYTELAMRYKRFSGVGDLGLAITTNSYRISRGNASIYYERGDYAEVPLDKMKERETYKGFDFNAIWGMTSLINDGYPYVRASVSEAKCIALGGVYIDSVCMGVEELAKKECERSGGKYEGGVCKSPAQVACEASGSVWHNEVCKTAEAACVEDGNVWDSGHCWNADGICELNDVGYDVGLCNLFKISSASQLREFAKLVNNGNKFQYKTIALENDIKLNGNWLPIGYNDKNIFSGTFDGNGYTISGLSVDSVRYAGLFGSGYGAKIKNLNVIASKIRAIATGNDDAYAGGLVSGAYLGAGAQIENCNVVADSVIAITSGGKAYAGGLSGWNGAIRNSTARANVKSSSNSAESYAGGAAGYLSGGLITKTSANGNVSAVSSTAHAHAGGLVGYTTSGTTSITDSYSTSNVSAFVPGSGSNSSRSYAGGLVGGSSIRTDITNSYASGNISALVAGGIFGSWNNSSVSTSVYYKSTGASTPTGSTNSSSSTGISAKTLTELKQQATFVGWDFADTWEMREFPYLRQIAVKSAEQLDCEQTAGMAWSKGACKTAEVACSEKTEMEWIDGECTITGRQACWAADFIWDGEFCKNVDEVCVSTGGTYKNNVCEINSFEISNYEQLKLLEMLVRDGNTFEGKTIKLANSITLSGNWIPIGTDMRPFKGTFDGQGYTIYNLSSEDIKYAGLFGYVGANGQIKNVNVVASKIKTIKITSTSSFYTGGLVGYYASAKAIENCNVKADSIISGSGGGLVGYDSIASIINSYAKVNIFGNGGGLVGTMGKGEITNSYANGNIFGSGGGLVSKMGGGRIIKSYASVNISGSSYYSGGLVGDASSGSEIKITDSYASGDVSTSGSDFYSQSGGLVGYAGQVNITRSYASGDISGNYAGGIFGYSLYSSKDTSVYYKSTGASAAAGESTYNLTGIFAVTSSNLKKQATFVGWDFADTWGIMENYSYPFLKSFPPFEVEKVYDHAYTGTQIKPEPKVSENGVLLQKGTDYTLSYGQNINAGTGTVTISLRGYENPISFNIMPKFLTLEAIEDIAVQDKVHDGTTNAVVTGIAIEDVYGIHESDIGNLNIAGVFASSDVGTDIPVNLVLTGTAAANYSLYIPELELYASITPAESSSSEITASSSSSSNLPSSSSSEITASSSSSSNLPSSSSAPVTQSSSSKGSTPILLPQTARANTISSMHNAINLQVQNTAKLEIYNLNGKLQKTLNLSNGVYNIPLGNLPKGMYIASVKFSNPANPLSGGTGVQTKVVVR